MKQLIACCGLDCENCDARIATINNDDKLREETAQKWSVMNNTSEITPETINCTVAVSMALNSLIAAIIVKSGNVFKQKDSTPVAIVKNWIIARPSVLFSSITPVQKKIFYRQSKITFLPWIHYKNERFLPWIYYNGITLLCQ